MKEKMKRFLRMHWKLMVVVPAIVVLVVGIMIVTNIKSKQNLEKTYSDTGINGIASSEEVKSTKVSTEETPQVEVTKESTESSKENTSNTTASVVDDENSETEKPSVTKSAATKSEEETTLAVKQTDKPDSQSETTTTVPLITETKYVPISEGWKAEASSKGDITTAQKADLDSMIQTWKLGTLSDAELKDKIISYLDEQKIDYMEVSVTSKGYALYDAVPVIDLRDGGNLYSYVGTYSTGIQNPDGTDKTVFYNWSAFVF